MITQENLLAWFQRLNVPEQTRTIIDHIRSSGPSRRVGGGHSNVSGRYPSRKMGVTIQFESHRVELAGILEMEHDNSVLEYFDQPPAIKLIYESVTGKKMGVLHTPDFFVLRQNEAGWEEWKTEEALKQLAGRNCNRYCAGSDGRWLCPPGVAYAEGLGLYYRVRSSKEIDWVYQRNIQFLEDYLRPDSTEVSPSSRDIAIAHVSATPGLTIKDLLQQTKEQISPDEIFGLIATNFLHVDLRASPLAEPWRVQVFRNAEAAATPKQQSIYESSSPFSSNPHCGSTVDWDGRLWRVVNFGETTVSLLSDEPHLTELPIAAYETLVREGRIRSVSSDNRVNSTIHEWMSGADERDLHTANSRVMLINDYLNTRTVPRGLPRRTLTRWLYRYRQAEAKHGSGFLGLLPQFSRRGNRTVKLPSSSVELMQASIKADYETLKQKTKYATWIALRRACEDKGIPAPSYKTFCAAAGQRRAFDQTLKRKGRRASYNLEPFYWDLDQKTPRHGDRPFEIVHVDHTELDVESVSRSGQVLGRPWITLLTDAFSRRILGFYLTFDPPSYRSCMMVLRECVRRFSRFPQSVVVDGGCEFQSTYFETLLARYECTKKSRPAAKARFGSVCERLFGTTNTRFIHNLSGNTQITRNVRQVTKAVDPKKLAVWPLAELHQRLAEFFYEVYDTLTHPALGKSPREAFDIGLVRTGNRLHRIVPYNEEFLMLTLPTTAKGTAKVSPSRGVKINHVYYWCQAFRELGTQGETVPVRYDPFDAGIAYAFVRQQWLQCHSEYYAALRDRSEREVMLVTKELHQQQHNRSTRFTITARRLAEFLHSVEAEETLLAQRLRDHESKAMRLALTNGATPDAIAPPHHAEAQTNAESPPLNDVTVDEIYGEF